MTHKLDEKALAPCPFCGGAALLWRRGSLEYACCADAGCPGNDVICLTGEWNRRAAAPSPAPVAVKIKPMEWRETVGSAKGRPSYRAKTIVGDYEVRSALPGVFGNFWRAPSGHDFEEETIDICFAAAQADFERRIRSALVDPVADEAGGLETLDDRQLRMNL